VIGDTSLLPKSVVSAISDAETATANNSSRFLNVALGYGGREELLHAIKGMVSKMKSEELDLSYITESNLKTHLYTNGTPYPDMIIRTAEKRLSNFMLWQSAYSELVFLDKFFPDVTIDDMKNVLSDYGRRERRFGK
jgi:undecaprenyl diphosphate synthase